MKKDFYFTLTVARHILTNISRSKGNQAMIFGQLIKLIMRNVFFLKNHTQNAMEILFPDSFLKNKIELAQDQYSKVSYSLFLWYAKLRTIRAY